MGERQGAESAPRGWPAWTAQVNDLVGGWVVTTYPYPISEHDCRPNGNPKKCGYVVAECMTEEDAATIARLLNEVRYMPSISNPERWRWVAAGYLEGTQNDGAAPKEVPCPES